MPHIVQMPPTWGRPTKKLLREQINANPSEIYFYDPSVVPGAWSGLASQMLNGARLVCTNHPQRSWFASVERGASRWVVK